VPAIAPHIAAAEAGVRIERTRILEAYRALASLGEYVIVEGAGGFRVPLGPGLDTSDVARDLGIPVVLVVGMRLGCLNHALLTADAVRAAGVPLAGWVANHIDTQMERANENVRALRDRLNAPLLARVAHAAQPDPRLIACDLDIDALVTRTT
jgi:dethiobiotin synthetase